MPEKEKTLEMRIAEIEDKLAQMHISDEEMKAYHKVANAMGMSGMDAAAAPQAGTQMGTQAAGAASTLRPISINRGILCRRFCVCVCPCNCVCNCFCNECICGPCIQSGGGGGFGGGFGGFGS